MDLSKKNILIGITGSVAASKSPDLILKLQSLGANIKCVITINGKSFVKELDLNLPKDRVLTNSSPYSTCTNHMPHIEFARWADIILIAPATANIIAKLTHGIADDYLSSICLASKSPLFIVPAMNKIMYSKQITKENLRKLTSFGAKILGPAFGAQACGDIGYGRMIEPSKIVENIVQYYKNKTLLKDTNIIITSGPTCEAIDPVRFISNRSSGKMGSALAKAATEYGAKVTFISGPVITYPDHCTIIKVKTAAEMYHHVLNQMRLADIFISCAAVSDYKADKINAQKIKKNSDHLTLNLIKNTDILLEVSKAFSNKFMVGFAAETENLKKNALIKLEKKDLDIIVANKVNFNEGFESEENEVMIIRRNGDILNLTRDSKISIAYKILEFIASTYKKQNW